MTDETLSRIERLEARLQDEPDSQALREELLSAFALAGLMNDPDAFDTLPNSCSVFHAPPWPVVL